MEWGEVGAQFLTLVIQAVIAAALPLLLLWLRQWIMARVEQAKHYLNDDQLRMAEWVVRMLVQAAEQSGLWDEVLKEGGQRKQWVLAEAERWFKDLGLPIDVRAISALIEAIVKDFNDNGWKKQPTV